MKTITAFLVSALIAVAAVAGAVVFLSRSCADDMAGGSMRGRPQLPIHFQTPEPIRVPTFERAVLTGEGIEHLLWQAQAKGPQPDAARNSWLRRFVCETRITDAILAALALFVLLLGLFLGRWLMAAVHAANRTARLVGEGVLAGQRPYVFLREFQVATTKNPLNDEIQTCAIQPVWENAGTTPTRHGRSQVNWKYFEPNVPAEFDFADVDDMGDRITSYEHYSPLTLGPRATALAPVITIEPSILRQVRDQQGKLLIWGWAEYDEVFDDARRHRVEFAYQVVVSGSPASHVGFSQYRQHNGIDAECMKQPTTPARKN